MIRGESKVEGCYRLTVMKGGKVTKQTEWFKNLITTQGLNYMGTNSTWLTACQVGTSNTAPANSDTALGARVAGTTTLASATSSTVSGSSPYYIKILKTFGFAEGVAEGVLAEVGVGTSTTGSTLFSRTLIVDGVGDPTTITVLADETLNVEYEFRLYAPLVDVTGTITLDSVSYATTVRALNVNTFGTSITGWGVAPTGTIASAVFGSGLTGFYVYDGAIAAITATLPTGTAHNATSLTAAPTYVADSFEEIREAVFGLDNGNFAGGIGAASFKFGWGMYQIGFIDKIPKTSSQILKLEFKHTWARYVP